MRYVELWAERLQGERLSSSEMTKVRSLFGNVQV